MATSFMHRDCNRADVETSVCILLLSGKGNVIPACLLGLALWQVNARKVLGGLTWQLSQCLALGSRRA